MQSSEEEHRSNSSSQLNIAGKATAGRHTQWLSPLPAALSKRRVFRWKSEDQRHRPTQNQRNPFSRSPGFDNIEL